MPCVIGVSIMPGATAPTRMPNGANSRDQVTVFAASAAFADDVVRLAAVAVARDRRHVDDHAGLLLGLDHLRDDVAHHERRAGQVDADDRVPLLLA